MPRSPFKIRDDTTFREYREHFRNHDYPAFPDDVTFLKAFGPQRLRDISEPQLPSEGFEERTPICPCVNRFKESQRSDEAREKIKAILANLPTLR